MSAEGSMDPAKAAGEEDIKLKHDLESLEGTDSLLWDAESDSDTPPTEEQWKTMKGYGSFITHDEEDVEHTFHTNDIIYVLPSGRDPGEDIEETDLWLAQIKSIRAHDSDSVWIRAKWFYHPTELPKHTKNANRKLEKFGSFERIDSNQADFIPTSTCCGHAKIIEFDEQSLEQENIESGTFYYRCHYDWQKKILKRPSPPCSICKRAYNPDADTMHFCPRIYCRRSWHTICLTKADWFIKSPENFFERIESLDGGYASPDPLGPSSKKKQKKVRTKKPDGPPMLEDPYARIPADLLAVARQPIARGGSLGVVGNVRSVVRARTMVQNALRNTEDIPENWDEILGYVCDASVIGPSVETQKKDKVFAYQCPQCGEPI